MAHWPTQFSLNSPRQNNKARTGLSVRGRASTRWKAWEKSVEIHFCHCTSLLKNISRKKSILASYFGEKQEPRIRQENLEPPSEKMSPGAVLEHVLGLNGGARLLKNSRHNAQFGKNTQKREVLDNVLSWKWFMFESNATLYLKWREGGIPSIFGRFWPTTVPVLAEVMTAAGLPPLHQKDGSFSKFGVSLFW